MCLVMDGKCNIHSNKLFVNGKKRIGVRFKVVTFQHTNVHKSENIQVFASYSVHDLKKN